MRRLFYVFSLVIRAARFGRSTRRAPLGRRLGPKTKFIFLRRLRRAFGNYSKINSRNEYAGSWWQGGVGQDVLLSAKRFSRGRRDKWTGARSTCVCGRDDNAGPTPYTPAMVRGGSFIIVIIIRGKISSSNLSKRVKSTRATRLFPKTLAHDSGWASPRYYRLRNYSARLDPPDAAGTHPPRPKV